jgi:nucleotide-binding universal stress UspA family protein
MKKIKNIVVATDLSATARDAYSYAKELANALDANLTIVHVKESLVIASDVMIAPPLSDDDTDLIKDIEELVAEENSATRSKVKGEVKIKVLNGDPVDVLVNISKSSETDLIVIGTTGLSDVLTKIFGSVSVKVSNKAHCPVILVPRDATWKPIKQILFSSNYDSMTKELCSEIVDFALNIHSGVHFVNIRNYDPPFEEKQKDIDWNELFVGSDLELSYEKHTIYGSDTINELKKYSQEKHINLIAFASKHRNFWENLMHSSITENMALSTTLPIMVMHLDDK